MADNRWTAVYDAVVTRFTDLGLTQAAFCKLSNVSETRLRQMRDGIPLARKDKVFALCKALGWSADSVERILAGDPPQIGYPAPDDVRAGRAAAIEHDPDWVGNLIGAPPGSPAWEELGDYLRTQREVIERLVEFVESVGEPEITEEEMKQNLLAMERRWRQAAPAPEAIAAKDNPEMATDPTRARKTAKRATRKQVKPGTPA